jgi:hypothetical protein
MDQHGKPPASTHALRQRVTDALTCPTCRRYRRGLFAVAMLALALWAGGYWR